jgi:uncharacterized membrane protein YgaE (UPF0421/DUF939 family)
MMPINALGMICMNRLIKNTKAIYFTNTLNDCKNNPKKMWKTINKLTNKKSKATLISEIRNDNQNLTKKHEIFKEAWVIHN